ncbi:MAG: SDR family NAD(P)-dependent oxidoreductase [Sphingomonadaceae bacterium]
MATTDAFAQKRWALVTGASDGIGRAFALELAGRGFACVLVGRSTAKLNEVAQKIGQADSRIMVADLSHADGVRHVIEAASDLAVELVVAAAGYGTSGSFVEADLANELAMIDVNCRAVAELVHHFGEQMAARRRGGIIVFSSIVAFQGVPQSANYAATKAYIQTLAEGLRPELKPFGVDVLSVAPGPIASGFAARAGLTMGLSQTPEIVARQSLAALGRKTTVRPGWLSKLLIGSLSLLPRWGRTLIMTQIMAGMIRK